MIPEHKYVRNKIAHSNSEIDDNKVTFIQKTKGLSIRKFGNDNILEISNDEYVIEIIDLIQSIFYKLIKAVDRRCDEI